MNRHQGTLLDVRTRNEFEAAHIEGAVNIPLNELSVAVDQCRRLQPPVTVYCHSGSRSARAVALLQAKGIQNVYNGGAMHQLQSGSNHAALQPPIKNPVARFFAGPLGVYRLVRIAFALFFFAIGFLYADGWMAYIFGAIFLATAFAKRPLCIANQCSLHPAQQTAQNNKNR